jgi:hypothetical protein
MGMPSWREKLYKLHAITQVFEKYKITYSDGMRTGKFAPLK